MGLYCTPLADTIFKEMFDGLPRIFRLFSLRNLIKLNQRSDFESRKQQMWWVCDKKLDVEQRIVWCRTPWQGLHCPAQLWGRDGDRRPRNQPESNPCLVLGTERNVNCQQKITQFTNSVSRLRWSARWEIAAVLLSKIRREITRRRLTCGGGIGGPI